ncbi:MAG: hypothetical protein WC619_02165 [Patescibacteria group bacterium]
MPGNSEEDRVRKKILIVCEVFVRQNIMRNILSSIFKGAELIVMKDAKDALPYLCANRHEISYIFCCHSDKTDSLAFLQMWREVEEFSSLPFIVVVMDENFVRVSEEAKKKGAIFIRFPRNPDRKSCADLIAGEIARREMMQRRKDK